LSSQNKLDALIADYTAARDDERELANQQVAMFSGVLATLTLFGVFAVSIGGQNIELPHPVAAATPLIPLSFFCLLQIMGSEATIRSFYLRALERQIRIELGPTAPIAGYPNLHPVMYRELIDEMRSLSRGARRLRIITYIVFFSVAFVFIGLVTYMARDFNGALKTAMIAVYGSGAIVLYLEARQATVNGRKYFESVVAGANLRLNDSLLPPPPPPSWLPRQRGLLAYLLIPRPNDLVKGLFFPVGALVLIALNPEVTGQEYFWQRLLALWFVLEFLIYQGRYQINDIRGIKEDIASPGASLRRRIPIASLSPSSAVKLVILTVLLRLAISVIISGFSFVSFFHHVLPMIVAVWAIAVIYEFLRGRERKKFEASLPSSSPPSSTLLGALVVLVVGLGYPVRTLLGITLPPSGGLGRDLPWDWEWPWNSEYVWTDDGINPVVLDFQVPVSFLVCMFLYSYLLGIVFVSMTWCLEGGSYVSRVMGTTTYSSTSPVATYTYLYRRDIFKKPHLALMLRQLLDGFDWRPAVGGLPLDGRRVRWMIRSSKRVTFWNVAVVLCTLCGAILIPSLWGVTTGDRFRFLALLATLTVLLWVLHRTRTVLHGRIYASTASGCAIAMGIVCFIEKYPDAEVSNWTILLLRACLTLAALALPVVLFKFFEWQSYREIMRPLIPPDIVKRTYEFIVRLIVGKETSSLL